VPNEPQLRVPVGEREAQTRQIGMTGADLFFDGGNLRTATGDSSGLLPPFLGDFVETAAIALQRCLTARQTLKALHYHVDILGVQLYSVADALGDFRGGERGTRSEEGLVHSFAALGVIQQRAPHEFHWLLRRVIELLLIGASEDKFG
jgi:hypothetical protein